MVLFIVSKIKALNWALFGVQQIRAVCSGLYLRFRLGRGPAVGAVLVAATDVYPSGSTGKAGWEPTATLGFTPPTLPLELQRRAGPSVPIFRVSLMRDGVIE